MKITILFVLFCATVSLGIKCRQCGISGACSSPSDNGIEKDCGVGFNACLYGFVEGIGSGQVQRTCGFYEPGNGCFFNSPPGGVSITNCYCTTDNCNQDDLCSCPGEEVLKCRQCSKLETGFKCDGSDDQGELKACPDPNLVCFFHEYDNGDTYRGCTIETGPEACFEGDDSRKCQCKSDNCNRDKECYPQSRCGSADKWYNF